MKYKPRDLKDCKNLFFEFYFPIEPKQSTRFGNGKAYKSAKVSNFEKVITNAFIIQHVKQYKQRLTGAIHYDATYYYKIPDSYPKWTKDAVKNGGKVYKETQPDLTDNMNKGIVDTIAPLIMANDGQIAKVSCDKFWSKEDKIICAFYELQNPL